MRNTLIPAKKADKYKIIEDALNLEKSIKKAKRMPESLSEADILYLEDRFLTNGFHYITVHDIIAGRSLMYRFLHSLNYYSDHAVLSIADLPLDSSITDIYYELLYGGYIDHSSYSDLDEFFINQFYYDFIWIEASKQLMNQQWFSEFFEKMINFKLNEHMPVLIVSYQQ